MPRPWVLPRTARHGAHCTGTARETFLQGKQLCGLPWKTDGILTCDFRGRTAGSSRTRAPLHAPPAGQVTAEHSITIRGPRIQGPPNLQPQSCATPSGAFSQVFMVRHLDDFWYLSQNCSLALFPVLAVSGTWLICWQGTQQPRAPRAHGSCRQEQRGSGEHWHCLLMVIQPPAAPEGTAVLESRTMRLKNEQKKKQLLSTRAPTSARCTFC